MVCMTHRWREMDSNFQYAGTVNLVVGPFGWVVLIGCGSGRGASGTARYQRRGWAILAAGVGAARRTARSMKAASSGSSTGLPARWPQIDGIGRNSAFCQVLHYHRQQVRQRAVILAQQHAAVRPRPLPAFHDDRQCPGAAAAAGGGVRHRAGRAGLRLLDGGAEGVPLGGTVPRQGRAGSRRSAVRPRPRPTISFFSKASRRR